MFRVDEFEKSVQVFSICDNSLVSKREDFFRDKSFQNESDLENFKSSVKSLNVNQLTSDIQIEMNLTKISHHLNSFSDCDSIEIENDSGFNSPSMFSSRNFKIESRSHYLNSLNSNSDAKFQLQSPSSYSIANRSISFAPIFLKDSLNSSLHSIKKSIISSKFAHFLQNKFFKKNFFTVLQSSKSIESFNDVSFENKESKNYSQFYNTGINTFRQILLRIYDVNYF